jgi:hypothetical protein
MAELVFVYHSMAPRLLLRSELGNQESELGISRLMVVTIYSQQKSVMPSC